ncbi:gamma-glutamylcyclotransferase family protein [Dyadobacter sandarakinus]|uniref:Gamma-glutamylcyclotransferase n=1 Tax=Dyadobacter sandarakinus TaxID=2747268 RepID=A0ABX7I8V0_9BACT|nr:gamma-glutamylcyclotransferase family protein [Dyadobacter sandarakinus]QRR02529.1 gamma-glutamylcyclotransferase [Dyadobacter sandarakinus]
MPGPNSVADTPDLPQYLFVYGTLMRGFANLFARKLEEEGTYLSAGSMPGSLYLVDWYPGAIRDESSISKVYGEVFRLHAPDTLLTELDEYEDVSEDEKSSLYLRKKVDITCDTGDQLLCWTYLYNQPVHTLSLLKSGNFRDWVKP